MLTSIAYFDRITVFEVLRYKHFEHDNAVEIRNRIMFNFYPDCHICIRFEMAEKMNTINNVCTSHSVTPAMSSGHRNDPLFL